MLSLRSFSTAVVASTIAALVAACTPEPPKLVLWIEVDTLRADALGCYGNHRVGENGASSTPNIDALAAEGVRFERAYSAAPWTIPSLVTQLSGKWPFEHKTMRLTGTCPEENVVLVPALRASGWRTAGVMTNFITTGKFGVARGFERWDDSFARGHEGSTSHEAAERLLAFADEMLRDPQKGVFLFAWFFEPHYRYEEHAGLRFGPGFGDRAAEVYQGKLTGKEDLNALLKDRATLTPEDVEFLRGRYASEVAWVDRAVGILVEGLKKRGVLDRTVIVFTADHGEEIMDRGWIGHTVTLHEEMVHVPWIVKVPNGRRGATVTDAVSLVDLPATVMDLAAGNPSGLSRSRSLASTVASGEKPARRWLYLHTDFEPVMEVAVSDEKRALMWGVVDATNGMKWVVDHKVGKDEMPRAFLWDVAKDPMERVNLAETEEGRKVAKEMQRLRGLVPERLEGRDGAQAMGEWDR